MYGRLLYDVWRDSGALKRHLDAGHNIEMPDSASRGATLLHRACCADVEAWQRARMHWSSSYYKQVLILTLASEKKDSHL
jgi:hypothetical protein